MANDTVTLKTEDELFPAPEGPSKDDFDSDRVYNLDPKDIFADEEFNCRGIIDPTSVIELAKDIKQYGLQQPILVEFWDKVPGKKYRILAGYRRYKAHQLFKLRSIRALVKPTMSDLEARILNLSENLQREDLNMKQEAHAIKAFVDRGWSEEQIAQRIGKSRGWVQVRRMLLDLPEEIQDEAAAGMLTQQQIRDCYSMPSAEMQFNYVRNVKDAKLLGKKRPVNKEKIIQKGQNLRKIRSREDMYEMQDFIREVFGNNFGTKVLAWASGTISDLDLHNYMSQMALREGKRYPFPEGLRNRREQVVEGPNED